MSEMSLWRAEMSNEFPSFDYKKFVASHATSHTSPRECFCVGKKNGEPYCRCEMQIRGVYQRDGQWVEPPRNEIIHGPVRNYGPTT